MVKLLVRHETNEEVHAEIIDDEPASRSILVPRVEPVLEQFNAEIAELKSENADLLSGCDRLNAELRRKDREVVELRSQIAELVAQQQQPRVPPDERQYIELNTLIRVLIGRLASYKFTGAPRLAADVREIRNRVRTLFDMLSRSED